MKTKISIVIPNYNGEKYIINCIDSLMKQSVRQFEIIIVDDASKDASMKLLMEKYPENDSFPRIKYIFHKENAGFCKSVNDGIKVSDSEFVIFLNNDTVADSEFVINMYRVIKRSERIFSVSAKMISLSNPELMDDAGDYYSSIGWAYTKAKDKKVSEFNKRTKVFAACGGAAIYRRSILNKVGFLDENHFAYLEDIDLGYRAKLFGYVNIYEPSAIVWHAGSASSGSRYNEFKAKQTAQNNIYLIYKNMPLYQILINGPFIIAGIIVKQLFYTRKGLGKAYLSGTIAGIKLINSKPGRKNRVDFRNISFINTFKIELELWRNTFKRFF